MSELLSGLFTPDPGVVDGLLALSVLYALAVGPGRKYLAPDQPFEKKRAVSFGIGFLILVAAVATPIDHIGETYLFSVHMLQHVMLMFFLPPFLVLAYILIGLVSPCQVSHKQVIFRQLPFIS